MAIDRPAYEHACELYQQGLLPEAAAACREVLSLDRQYLNALKLLGLIGHRLGEFHEAIECYTQATLLQPDSADLQNRLGSACLAAGEHDTAAVACQRALRLDPTLVAAHLTLGNVRYTQGRLDEAAASYRSLLAIQPDYVDAWNNLGLVHKSLGRLDDASQAFRQVLQLQPGSPGAWLNLGNVYKEQANYSDAVAALHCAIQLAPGYALAHQNLGELLDAEGRTDEATVCYHESLRLTGSPALRLQIAMALPPVYESVEQLQAYRDRLLNELDLLTAEGVRFNPLKDKLPNWFYLAYQGLDDRAIHESIARLCTAGSQGDSAMAPWAKRRDHRIYVGFVSSLLKDHTIGQLFRGFIDKLPRDRFHVTVVSLAYTNDSVAEQIRAGADAAVELQRDLQLARQRLAGLQLDVLLYTDLGMDPSAYALASCRLAPVQCAAWGHPVTSGLPTVDYFISSELIEPEEGQSYYTERLVKLPVLPTYYYRPKLSDPGVGREHFGLLDNRHVYLCPQNLFKFHPDFDAALADILDRDPLADIVLIEGRYPHWTELLNRRFRRMIGRTADRIRFIPSQSRPDFLQLLAAADVILDTFHFGGGNTSYEAIAVGTPVVTLPSGFMRGRVTHGCYRQIDVLDCIASSPEDYVRIAVDLATNRDRRDALSAKLIAAGVQLFEDQRAVDSLAAAFESANRNR